MARVNYDQLCLDSAFQQYGLHSKWVIRVDLKRGISDTLCSVLTSAGESIDRSVAFVMVFTPTGGHAQFCHAPICDFMVACGACIKDMEHAAARYCHRMARLQLHERIKHL